MLDKINSYDNQVQSDVTEEDEKLNKVVTDNSENDNVELSKEAEEFAKKLLEGM